LKALKFAVDSFQDWMETAMIKSGQGNLGLPDSLTFTDAVNQITTTNQTFSELTDSKRTKQQTLSRLQVIAQLLKSFADQPAPGSQQEKDLIAIQNQYDAVADSISNSITIANTQAQLDSLKDQYNSLLSLVGKCTNERGKAGWTIPPAGMTWRDTLAQGSSFTSRIAGGIQAIKNRFSPAGQAAGVAYAYLYDLEEQQFCGLPIAYGYNHDSFRDPWQPAPYPDVPLVNGSKVYTYKSGLFSWGSSDVDITINCNTIFRAGPLDYKGDLPGSPYAPTTPPQAHSSDCGLSATNPDGTCGSVISNGANDPIGTCTTTTNGTSTTTQTTQSGCISPGVWTAPATNTGTTNNGTNTGTQTQSCGSAGQPACG